MELSPEEIDLIRTSYFRLSVDLKRAGNVFYEKLFEIAPETRSLFVQDMTVQAGKLMSTLGFVVSQLQNAEDLEPIVKDLALRHLAYGVEKEHYFVVRQALLEMLETVLHGSFSEKDLTAWGRAYDSLVEIMIDAAYPIDSLQDRRLANEL
ncbi:globin domain-containing protein [Roseibium sp. MMSF_3544]|uniref:globin domain-containing protein n=1 Tax=unclassified Roseibium TaxID=2629323 RepID=UPI00273E92AE|nr:globin domain-containing protein [Roseibium sp. MMSF_3544]